MNVLQTTVGQVVVASWLVLAVACDAPAVAESISDTRAREEQITALLEELAQEELPTWEAVEERLTRLWSRSGSASADLLLQRGEDAIEAEDYTLAIEHLTALTDHAPNFAEGWHMRATAFYLAEEHGLAIADLRRALALNPNHFSALTGLGIILEEAGDYDAALAVMERARAINPHREMVRNVIERLNGRLGRSTL